MNRACRHILVATDFSDDAERATRAGAALAHRFGARVTLLHVFDSGLYESAVGVMKPSALEMAMAKSARDELERIAGRLLVDVEGVDCVAVRSSTPAQAILEHAERFGVDLVVVGTHARGALAALLVDGVTEQIVRAARCPVFSVPNGKGGRYAADPSRELS